MQPANEARKIYLSRLKEDLMGPKNGEQEVINQDPTTRYLLGILWPKLDPRAEDEEENFQDTGTHVQEDANEEIIDNPSSVFKRRKPSCAGLSFYVELNQTSEVKLELNFSFYKEIYEEDPRYLSKLNQGKDDQESSRAQWIRIPISITKKIDITKSHIISLEEDLPQESKGKIVIVVNSKKMGQKGNKYAITLKVLNKEIVNASESDEYFFQRREKSIFQFQMHVEALENSFFDKRENIGLANDEDTKISKLIYRKQSEYASGHICSCSWLKEEGKKVTKLSTNWFPSYEVAPVNPEGSEKIFQKIRTVSESGKINAKDLGTLQKQKVIELLSALAEGYAEWILQETKKVEDLEEEFFRIQAKENLGKCMIAKDRMLKGIDQIKRNQDIFSAFQAANLSMQKQFIWTKLREAKLNNLSIKEDEIVLEWRPFQIGFFLMSLTGLAIPEDEDREIMDLLWFPTGGGKTEAYSLLIAFQLFLIRIKGGESSDYFHTDVIMRYTLRALTLQQFQRAAAVIFACNLIRKENENSFGQTPFSIGLFVGDSMTPNKLKDSKSAIRRRDNPNNPNKLSLCPACGEALEWKEENLGNRTLSFEPTSKISFKPNCVNSNCDLHQEDLRVRTIDEHIYLEPPSLIFGTADKFAQLVRQSESGRIFDRKLPPSLIIQDELHLMTGPLGSMSGLLEMAIDELCTDENGFRPKIIGSTATIRQAKLQVRRLFDRESFQFPPQAIDFHDSGFALSEIEKKGSGRLYVGICTQGSTEKMIRENLSASVLQSINDENLEDHNKDLYSTLVSYFGSTKILGGFFTGVQEAVKGFTQNYASHRNESIRSTRSPAELTGRTPASDLDGILKDLNEPYSADRHYETLLATNMISVGVDIPRLGLMSVNGQPKSMTEYIQATSRVGRKNPGLILTLYNSARIRDKSRYEKFQTWHSALYSSVEATSMSPFSPRAMQKALHQPLIIICRHLKKVDKKLIRGSEDHQKVKEVVEKLLKRIEKISPKSVSTAKDEFEDFIEDWILRSDNSSTTQIKYWWASPQYPNTGLMAAAELCESRRSSGRRPLKAKSTPQSVRNVDPGVQFYLEGN